VLICRVLDSFGATWRSFWHTMTSQDRHASHDSPYRTGQHMPLNQSRHAPLTSIATSALDSRPDLNSPYVDESSRRFMGSSQEASNGWPVSPGLVQTPTSPYSPGMRSAMQKKQFNENPSFDRVTHGEIQMQNFQDGLPPPPPVAHSWKKIQRWVEDNYEELYDQLSEGCTQNDVNELEHELDCSLPLEVRESLQVHDGQERGGLPTGIIFGCMLLDCEEIVQEWKNWRVVNEEYLSAPVQYQPRFPSRALGGASSSSFAPPQPPQNPLWRQELTDRQDSQPPRAVQKAYAHSGWIPLARDWGGNNIAVDLAPGPAGKWGQIIIFGRDYDCKYVVARSWSAFLAMVADDMCSEKVFVDEETQELKLREFKTSSVEPGYLDILRWRMDQKYGRKGPRRRPMTGPDGNGSLSPKGPSPYGSPRNSNEERGRSPQRFAPKVPTPSSPRGTVGKSSPLARVSEETRSPVTVHTSEDASTDSAATETPASETDKELVEVATPRVSDEDKRLKESGDALEAVGLIDDDEKADRREPTVTSLGVNGLGHLKGVEA